MAKNSSTESRKIPSLGVSPDKGREIAAVLMGFAVVFLTASFLSFHPEDPSLLSHSGSKPEASNLVGPVGAHLGAIAFALLGLTALVIPVVLGSIAWFWFRSPVDIENGKERLIGCLAVLLSLPGTTQLLLGDISWRGVPLESGGVVGVLTARFLVSKLNVGGAFLILATILLVGGSLATRTTLRELAQIWRQRLATWWQQRTVKRVRHEKSRDRQTPAQESNDTTPKLGTAPAQSAMPEGDPEAGWRRRVRKTSLLPEGEIVVARAAAPAALEARQRPPKVTSRVVEKPGEGQFSIRKVRPETPTAETSPLEDQPLAPKAPVPPVPEVAKPAEVAKPTKVTTPAAEPAAPVAPPVRRRKPPKPIQETIDFPEDTPSHPDELPPVNLLKTAHPAAAHDEDELVACGVAIRRAASEFGVEGNIQGASPGPVITTYEFQPAPGVKVSKIVNLQDDLALTLRAESVRIDRIPGRSTLGIEVPNDKRSVINLGSLLAAKEFEAAESVLTMAVGVDLHGRPYFADLAKMPHLLVAGATGAGKSVGLQSMITSIIYKATREDVQFIFIDPKRIELGVYADIPHLKTEVVVEPKKAANALRWAVSEMERRYRLLAEVHVRSIDFYNRAIKDPAQRARLSLKEDAGESEFKAEDFKPLPYYVIVIDELADLMMVASSDVEASIARLAQMARAVGIHLIVATQRPSVDVLTGTIKANFPCRLAYATATRHDSRTILDQIGAEKLLGKGDALFMPPGTSRIMRLHGAYISEEETAGLIRWLKRRGTPMLDPDVVKDPEEGNGGNGSKGGNDGGDALFDEAARLVVRERQASASFLQRRMRVGFSRAARLIDMLEADGILGPAQGSKSRDVLVPPDFFEEIDQARSEE